MTLIAGALCSLILVFWGINLKAQSAEKWVRRGDQLVEEMAYVPAIESYEKALGKEEREDIKEKVAAVCKKLGDTRQAELWYAQLANLKGAKTIYKLQYAEMLRTNGKYDEALKWLREYRSAGGNEEQANRIARECNLAIELLKDSSSFKIQPLTLNTSGSEFAPVPCGKGILFSSNRRRGFFTRVLDLRSNSLFYDLYYAEKEPGKTKWKTKVLKGVNSRFHEGPAALAPSENVLFFTRSNFKGGKLTQNNEGINKLQIFSAEKTGKNWSKLQKLPFNSDEYSSAHPTISRNGKFMVFSSDNPGGFGGSDLYMSVEEGEGWSKPVNLGAGINTPGDEMFPFLHESGTLFFSSDGHTGLGGLDIFYSLPDNGGWSPAKNAGAPLNSQGDDFGLNWIKGKSQGYFSSNREGGSGKDDIFAFTRQNVVRGIVADVRTGKPIEGATVTVFGKGNRKGTSISDANGAFEYVGSMGRDVTLTVIKDGFEEVKSKWSGKDLSPMEDLSDTITMQPEQLFTMSGKMIDAKNGALMGDGEIRLVGGPEEVKLSSEKNGDYFAKLNYETDYVLIYSKAGYRPEVRYISTKGLNEAKDFRQNISLTRGNFILVEGKVFDKKTGNPLKDANVRVIEGGTGAEEILLQTKGNGLFWTILPPFTRFYLIGSKEGYFAGRADLPPPDSLAGGAIVSVDIELVTGEVGALVKRIYYDYGASFLSSSSTKALDEIVYFLIENPTAKVELASHTDATGPADFNYNLSLRRSQACVNYLIAKGIAADRVIAAGYGERQLVNDCADGVDCPPEMHQLNRRTEITISGIDPEKR